MAAIRCRSSKTYNHLLESGKVLDVHGKWLLHTSNDCLNTAQPTVQNINKPKYIHSGKGNKNVNNADEGQTKSSLFNIGKMKENVIGAISSVSLEIPDLSKVMAWKTYIRKSKKDENPEVQSHSATVYQMKKAESTANKKSEKPSVNDTDIKREEHSLEKHIKSTNKSIISYYDTSVVMTKMASNSADKTQNASVTNMVDTNVPDLPEIKTVDEPASTWRIFGFASRLSPSNTATDKSIKVVRKDFVSKSDIERTTRGLVRLVKSATTDDSKLSRIENLCKHLLEYPDSRSTAQKGRILPCLLKLQQSGDKDLRAAASRALSLVGYVAPPHGQGYRVLTIDGGGTRGLVALKTLKKLQEACDTELWKLFDYVAGVSTGSLLAVMVFLYRLPLDEVERLYIDSSRKMFTRNRILGAGSLFRDHAYYDKDIFEQILKENFGERITSEFAADPLCPKMSSLSCIINITKMKNYVFRTYNLPPDVYSQYPGSCKHKVWEMIRASSAAPAYFEQFMIDEFVHQDGGVKANNPTAIALHECKRLWPDEPLQCVISLGNGRYEPNLEVYSKKTINLVDKAQKIAESATDTEDTHITLDDILPHSTYFRFNPYMSEDFPLDTIDSSKLLQLSQDAEMYLRKNEYKINKAKEQLMLPRQRYKKMTDYVKWKADTFEFGVPLMSQNVTE
ncbi:hypothetical protein KUTeg_020941 [Tegillarca granosa]|uniref:PNPLA domain-containing protein n=2 Tax=Tegillarca granosa TaxID=220873 RepID=A0ABQ9E9C7_TEGGR|nr:hypothetical protein KUTeg_020941 [Tegillarca granosa]